MSIFFIGCNKENNLGDSPIFLEVANFEFDSNSSIDDSKIKGAWCFIGEEFIGYYPLPNTIPIFIRQTESLKLLPCIYANGIAATPEDYPFYEPFIVTIDPLITEPEKITPTTSYIETIKFSLLENFENGQSYFSKPLNNSPINHFQIQQNQVFEGKNAALIKLNLNEAPSIEIATSQRWSRTSWGNQEVYLELNYKTPIPILFGLVGFPNATDDDGLPLYQYGVNPSDNWNKIYFKLNDLLVDTSIEAYSLCFYANLEGFDMEQAEVFLDNIKIIHF